MTHPMEHYCKEYRDDCEGCQPALLNPKTGQKFPPDSPEMIAVAAFWKTVTIEQKQACHRVWCFNSREENDVRHLQTISEGMRVALSNLGS
jgi:hypothetical protein